MNKRDEKGDEQKGEEEAAVLLGLGNFVIKTRPKIKEVGLIHGKFLNAQSNVRRQPPCGSHHTSQACFLFLLTYLLPFNF